MNLPAGRFIYGPPYPPARLFTHHMRSHLPNLPTYKSIHYPIHLFTNLVGYTIGVVVSRGILHVVSRGIFHVVGQYLYFSDCVGLEWIAYIH